MCKLTNFRKNAVPVRINWWEVWCNFLFVHLWFCFVILSSIWGQTDSNQRHLSSITIPMLIGYEQHKPRFHWHIWGRGTIDYTSLHKLKSCVPVLELIIKIYTPISAWESSLLLKNLHFLISEATFHKQQVNWDHTFLTMIHDDSHDDTENANCHHVS